ncbi:hypothetical protein PHJA_001344300 [Phtheirospermum japonicum]|uniref:RRM domain-containing protein n=1 Tax=Phtheirospermum japonicum TaxID=374723 RepID=A0A830C1F9_9LAMI|nr:hypothetical protein PHJA_001344300 [Phtheirospermum japonicum]
MIHAGRVLDIYIPRDRETNKLKGYAFTEYESKEVAAYAFKLFTGPSHSTKRTLNSSVSHIKSIFAKLLFLFYVIHIG